MLLQTAAADGSEPGFFLEAIKAINGLATWVQVVGLALVLLTFLACTILWRMNPGSSAQRGFAKVLILAILAVFVVLILAAMWISASGERDAAVIRGQLQEFGVSEKLDKPLTLTALPAGQAGVAATEMPPGLAEQIDEFADKSLFYSQAGVEGFSSTAPSIARLALWDGRPEEAKRLIEASLELGQSSEEAKALNDLGVIYYTEARKAENEEEKNRLLGIAAEHFGQALQRDPALVTAINNLGLIELERGNLEAALAGFNKALALNPGYARALNNRGLAYRRLAQRTTEKNVQRELFAKAKADFLAGIAKEPGIADIHYNLALLEDSNLKNPVAAAEQYRKTIELDSRNATALNNLSTLLQQQESAAAWQEAVLLAQQAVAIQPDEPCLLDTLARAHLGAGDCAHALEGANRAVELLSKGAGQLRCNKEDIRSLPQQVVDQCPAARS